MARARKCKGCGYNTKRCRCPKDAPLAAPIDPTTGQQIPPNANGQAQGVSAVPQAQSAACSATEAGTGTAETNTDTLCARLINIIGVVISYALFAVYLVLLAAALLLAHVCGMSLCTAAVLEKTIENVTVEWRGVAREVVEEKRDWIAADGIDVGFIRTEAMVAIAGSRRGST